jgi:hypothetical protein
MRATEAATLAIKVLALFVLTKLPEVIAKLGNEWGTFNALTSGAEVSSHHILLIALSGFQILLILLFAAGLWIWAPQISRKIFPQTQVANEAAASSSNVDWVRVILGMMGIWLMMNSFPYLVASIISFFTFGNTEGEFRPYIISETVTQLLRFITGTLLLLWEKFFNFFKALLLFQQSGSDGFLRVSVSSIQCPYCKERIEGQERWVCRQCGAQHHQACWAENEGCAVFGCIA